jgi:hypothetical protein
VRIYADYAVIEGKDTTFYGRPILNFAAPNWRARISGCRFAKNVYDTWMSAHLDRIGSFIDELPADVESSRYNEIDIPAVSP